MDETGITFCQSSLDVFGDALWKNELHKMQIIISLMLVIPFFFNVRAKSLIQADSFTHT